MESMGLTVMVDGGIASAGETVREALKAEGFGVLTEIDVEATLRTKLGDGAKEARDRLERVIAGLGG